MFLDTDIPIFFITRSGPLNDNFFVGCPFNPSIVKQWFLLWAKVYKCHIEKDGLTYPWVDVTSIVATNTVMVKVKTHTN